MGLFIKDRARLARPWSYLDFREKYKVSAAVMVGQYRLVKVTVVTLKDVRKSAMEGSKFGPVLLKFWQIHDS